MKGSDTYPTFYLLDGDNLVSTKLGRDILYDVMNQYDVPFIFGNPGTSELPFIEGVVHQQGVEYISALHEANAVGMAMGYARQSKKPGVVVLHVAPGLANGMGNIYNAFRASIPLVVIVGQHHNKLLIEEPILAGDHVSQVRSMTKWAHEIRHIDELPIAIHRAFKVAMTPPHGPVFLSIPYNIALTEVKNYQIPTKVSMGHNYAGEFGALEHIVDQLLEAKEPLIVAGDGVGDSYALQELHRFAELLGLPILSEGMPTRVNVSNRHKHYIGTPPMNAKTIRSLYSKHDVIFFIGNTVQAPFALFDGQGSLIDKETNVLYLHHDTWSIGKNYFGGTGAIGHIKYSLEKLIEIACEKSPLYSHKINSRKQLIEEQYNIRQLEYNNTLKELENSKTINASVVAHNLNQLLQGSQDFMIVNEAVSNASPFIELIDYSEENQYTAGKGGGLGHAVSQSIGASLAEPERKIICVVGDGTFLYYPQVLYSALQTNANVLYLVINNEAYEILKIGYRAIGKPLGNEEIGSLDLKNAANIQLLAQSFGVKAKRVSSINELKIELEKGVEYKGPYLIDITIQS